MILQKNLTNPLYSYLWNVLKIDLANYKNLLDQTKANAKYRAIYIDLKANGLPLPNEDSSHLLKFLIVRTIILILNLLEQD